MSQLTNLWHYIYSSPNFGAGVVGIASAFGGSWGAQLAIMRRDYRREVLTKLNAINEGQALCFTIASNYMSVKKQHINPMLKRYRQVAANFQEHMAKQAQSKTKLEFHYEADLQSVPVTKVPTELLERSVFDKIGPDAKSMAVTVELIKAIDNLSTALTNRNDYVEKIYRGPEIESDEFLARYLGLRHKRGVDAQYATVLQAIEAYCNDCIFFSKTLSECLGEYGDRFRSKHRWGLLGRRLPKVAKPNYATPEARALLPDEKEYTNWVSAFQKAPTKMERLKSFFSGDKTEKPPRSPAPKS